MPKRKAQPPQSFSDWLRHRFMEWQFDRDLGDRRSRVAFAQYLGVSYHTLGKYLRGESRPPRGSDNLRKLAVSLGEDVYDLLDYPRPDRRLDIMIVKFPEASPSAQTRALRVILDDVGEGDQWDAATGARHVAAE